MRRTFIKFALLGAATLLVAGCASGPKYDQMASSIPSIKPGQGRVYFFRESSMVGGALTPDIKLNGAKVGESVSGGFFYVDRPAGNYVASASTETEKTLSFGLQAGETKYVRSSISMGILAGRAVLDLESADKARPQIATLTYTAK